MRFSRTLALGATMLVLARSACSSGGGSSKPSDQGRLRAASTKPSSWPRSTRQVLENAGYTVNRDGIGLGERKVLQRRRSRAARSTSSRSTSAVARSYGVRPARRPATPPANLTALQTILNGKGGGITVLNYTPAQDQNAFVVRKETADQLTLTKMSDVAAVQDQLKLGLATDCPTNPLCGQALKDAYGIDTSKRDAPRRRATPRWPQALVAKTIDLGELCSTQPDILVNGFVLLQDDKQTQPADNIAPLVRNDFLAKTDKTAFEKLLNDLSAKIDTATLADLYKQVSVDKKDIKDVVSTWLKAQGLVK